jgi:predicted RNA-binding Zn-ribbon protein involved in translation (DUF1610 family)
MKKIKLTESEYRESCNYYAGFCIACGQEEHNIEPDAEKYRCSDCGKKQVYGAEQLLLLGLLEIVED